MLFKINLLASFEMMQIVMVYLFEGICIISNLGHKVKPIDILYDTILDSLCSNLKKKKKLQRFSNLSRHQNHLEGLLKQLTGPYSGVLDSENLR